MVPSWVSRVLIIEDHAPTRAAVTAVLVRAGLKPTPVGTLADGLGARAADYDAALIDLHLGPDSGIEAIRALAARGLPCLAFTVSDDAPTVLAALEAGAAGYVLKDEDPAQVVRALQEAVQGRTPISSGVAGHLLRALHPAPPEVHLTPRERDVLIGLARGLTYAETAAALGLGIGTVQSYVKQLYGKLGVSSKTQACAWAIRHGMAR